MELRHLRYFVAVAEELNFSRAAERLKIAQPPLSQQIQALEAELKVQLFDRKKRPLQLTLAGQAFLEDTRLALAQVEQAVRTSQHIHRGESGYLTVGFTSSMANGVLPNILRAFREQYPSVKLILREENSTALLQGLRDRYADVVFTYHSQGLTEASDLGNIPLPQEPLVVVVPDSHPLAAHSKIEISDLADEDFVMPLPQVVTGLSTEIYLLCSQSGFVPKVAQEAVFMVTILGLVAGKIGVSILPSGVQSLRREAVVYRSIKGRIPMIQPAVVWQQNNSSTALQNFLAVANNVVRLSGG